MFKAPAADATPMALKTWDGMGTGYMPDTVTKLPTKSKAHPVVCQ